MIIYFILYFLLYFQIINSNVIIPFIKKPLKNNNINLESITKNGILINIEIGEPKQKMTCEFSFINEFIIVPGIQYKSQYNELVSKTYKQIRDKEDTFDSGRRKGFIKGILSNEIFYINNKKYNFDFILATNYSLFDESKYCTIGLKLKINYEVLFLEGNFLKQLNDKHLIDNFVFNFRFISENKGELIIGDNRTYSNQFKPSLEGKLDSWHIIFQDINYNYIEENFFDVTLALNLNGIIAPNSYKYYINEFYFNEYLNNNYCKEETIIKDRYIGYVCNNKIDLEKFTPLKLKQKELDFTFILDYNDLFLEINKKYYYLVIFQKTKQNYWSFGEPFLRKYNLIYDLEKKIIGFNKTQYYENSIKKQNIKNKKKFFSTNYLIYFLLIIIIFILSYKYYNKNKNSPRKIKVNELSENFDYSSKEYKIIN